MPETFDFAVFGINHAHIYGQVDAMLDAGCRLTAFHAPEDDLAAAFAQTLPAGRAASPTNARSWTTPRVRLVVGAGIPAERAGVALRAMRAGKDVMVDKPGCTTEAQLAELRRVQAETGRIFSICYSEHYLQPATVAAARLVAEGAHRPRRLDRSASARTASASTPAPTGSGTPRAAAPSSSTSPRTSSSSSCTSPARPTPASSPPSRPTSTTPTRPAGATTATPPSPPTTPPASSASTGSRPTGSPVWGDGRLFLVGTEGTIELRKYVDIEGRPGGDHLFLTDAKGTRHIDASGEPLPYGAQLRDDVAQPHRDRHAAGPLLPRHGARPRRRTRIAAPLGGSRPA